jgi:hypothetical protein
LSHNTTQHNTTHNVSETGGKYPKPCDVLCVVTEEKVLKYVSGKLYTRVFHVLYSLAALCCDTDN